MGICNLHRHKFRFWTSRLSLNLTLSQTARLEHACPCTFYCYTSLVPCHNHYNIMVTSLSSPLDTPPVSELSTPLTQSGRTSPTSIDVEVPDESPTATQKKKKKKKSKKSAKSKDSAQKTASKDDREAEGRPPALCISRNKHWRYISSYHVGVQSPIHVFRDQTQPFVRDLGFNSLSSFLILS